MRCYWSERKRRDKMKIDDVPLTQLLIQKGITRMRNEGQ